MGATQIGLIASEPIPAYAKGGMIYGGEQIIRVNEKENEAVLTGLGIQTAGGESAVNSLNMGVIPSTINNDNSQRKDITVVQNFTFNNPNIMNDDSIRDISARIVEQSKQGLNDIEIK